MAKFCFATGSGPTAGCCALAAGCSPAQNKRRNRNSWKKKSPRILPSKPAAESKRVSRGLRRTINTMAIADTPISPLPAPENRSRFHDLVRSLRHRNFQLFFSGQLISLIGTWMQNIAQAWLVYRLTGSSLLLGIVGFAGQIPIFLFAPIGGLAADRWNRHPVVIGTQVASMILAFILAAL